MSIFHSLLLGILQGLTEFIPVSSSGHLVLAENFLNLDVADDKFFDVVLHLGTSLALIVYFWKDWWGIIKSMVDFLNPATKNAGKDFAEARLGYYIVIGSIPAAIVGFTFNDYFDIYFRNVLSVSIFMIVIGTVFLLAEKVKPRGELSARKTFLIGIAQAVALIPGISRSGITISAGMLQGVSRAKAARFSFMLGLPAILGAGLLSFLKLESTPDWSLLSVGFLSSALVSFLAIRYMLAFLKNHTLHVFAYYLCGLGLLGILLSFLENF